MHLLLIGSNQTPVVPLLEVSNRECRHGSFCIHQKHVEFFRLSPQRVKKGVVRLVPSATTNDRPAATPLARQVHEGFKESRQTLTQGRFCFSGVTAPFEINCD